MNGNFLLDTNSIIAFLNRETAVLAQLAQAESFAISCITAGELRYGAYNSGKVQFNLDRLESYCGMLKCCRVGKKPAVFMHNVRLR